jgi:hypothetical protein
MASGQPTKPASASANQADTSGDSIKSVPSESMPQGESQNSSPTMAATTQSDSSGTLKSAELVNLQSKAGLVAGALADFQAAGGIVVSKEVAYKVPSGRIYTAIKLYLIVRDAAILKRDSADGLDFYLVADKK